MRLTEDVIPPRNRTIAPDVLAWIDCYLVQFDGARAGDPFELTREQSRILARWFAVDERGTFLYRRGVLRRMKGWGKTPLGAVLGAVELCGPCRCGGFDSDGNPVAVPHRSPWVVLAATSLDQTKNSMRALHGLFSADAVDDYRLEIAKLIIHSRDGQLECSTSNPRVVEGARSTFVLLDETQEWVESNRGIELAGAIRRNVAKLGDARTWETCNAHRPNEGSVAEISAVPVYTARDRGETVPGLMYDALVGEVVEDLADAEALRASLEVARGDSTWLDLDRLVAEIQDPATPPSVARRYYLNQVVEAEGERFMEAALWDSLARPEIRIPRGAKVVLGFDGGYSSDHTALVVVAITKHGRHLDLVKVWKPDGTPNWTVPVLEVEDEIRACCERWTVRELVADPSRWQRSLELLSRELHRPPGRSVVPFPQQNAQRMAEATNSFLQACGNGTLTHSGNLDLRAYVLNAVADETAQGYRLRKRTQREKIDAAVAAVMAHHRSLHYNYSASTVLAMGAALHAPLTEEELARERREADEVIAGMADMLGATTEELLNA